MDCTDWRTVLSSVLDDEASSTERAGADAHLATCPACTAWVADARALRVTVAEDVPDLTATILELGRAVPFLTADHALDGSSRLTTLLEGDQGWRAPVMTEGRLWTSRDAAARRQRGFTSPVSYIGLRTPRWSFVRYDRGEEELYDLSRDANELTNVVDDPVYADVVTELRRLWRQYAGCAGPRCRRGLPDDVQAGPRVNSALTTSFWAQVAERAAATLRQ